MLKLLAVLVGITITIFFSFLHVLYLDGEVGRSKGISFVLKVFKLLLNISFFFLWVLFIKFFKGHLGISCSDSLSIFFKSCHSFLYILLPFFTQDKISCLLLLDE